MATNSTLIEEQYRIEKEYADKIRASAPFSPERAAVTNAAYRAVNALIAQRTTETDAFGRDMRYVSMVNQLLSGGGTFFEAGIGTGLVIREVSKRGDIAAIGCDVYVDRPLECWWYLLNLAQRLVE